MSWWCGLTREELQIEIAKREPGWRALKRGILDTIGARLLSARDEWDLRRSSRTRQPYD